jgi:L-2,4-diaminobutyrate decarboxylase
VASDPYSAEEFRREGHAVIDLLAEYLESTARREGKVLEFIPPAEMLERWPDVFRGAPGSSLVELLPRILGESHHLHHPRYVGHQVSSPLPSAALSELVSALLNNGTAEYEMGPVANVMERRLIDWLGSALGFGAAVEGMFTSGGSVGNLTALAAARQAVAGRDIWTDGLTAGPPLAILISAQTHYSVDRAVRILGFGEGGVVPVATDARYRLDPGSLREAHRRAEQAGRQVIAVVGSACSTAIGAFDPLVEIADYAAEHGLWFHVDGAHGAVAGLTKKYRHLVDGVARADSVVVDAHKMLQVPALSTAVIFRRPGIAARTFQQQQSYIGFRTTDAEYAWWDSGIRTLECTKRMTALALYATLRRDGIARLGEHVEQTFDLARRFAELVREASDFECAVDPEANIVCFRYAPGGTADLDALQLAIREEILRRGDFYIVKTTLPTGIYLRITIMNARTTEDDLRALLDAIRDAAETARI